jgi:5'-3' exonuclease
MANLAERFLQFQASIKDQPTDKNAKVLIVDGLNLFIRVFAVSQTLNDSGQHVGGLTGFFISLAATIRSLQPTRVVICFDGQNGSTRRRKIFPNYKGNRKSMTKLNRTYDFATLEDEVESRKWQLKTLVTMLNFLPVTVMAPDNIEADDTIAELAQYIELHGGSSIILSNDKDFLQLVSEKTLVYNPAKKKMYRPKNVVEDYGIHPNNFLIYRTITGDNSDCIPGVYGIKEKTLLKFFPELADETKRDIDYLLDRTAEMVQDKKKPPVALTTLLDSKELLERNIKLMRLDEAAASGMTRTKILDAFDSPIQSLNRKEFNQYVGTIKITTVFSNIEQWLSNSFDRLEHFGKQ